MADRPPKSVRIAAKRSGAWLARWALEQLPVSYTFGIPGVHTTELYDELGRSERIRPILVTHEAGAAFMADAVSRTSRGEIGVLVVVPAAGVTHALSGIGEAFLDGIPLLVIAGGTRTDLPYGFQLHELDQRALVAAVTKGAWKVERHVDVVPTLLAAYRTAVAGMPGPVLVELPANIQLLQAHIDEVPAFEAVPPPSAASLADSIERAAELLCQARRPGLFVGWGAVDAIESTGAIAELLGAPVSTTLQGLSAFPGNHPLFAGMGFSRAAVPAAEKAFAEVDCLLAVGTRFGEIPTGSFGARVPEALVHVDIDERAIGRNYPAKVGLVGDARVVLPALLEVLRRKGTGAGARRTAVEAQLAADRQAYRQSWLAHRTERVNPAAFFAELRRQLSDDAIMVVDDGNHTFLAAELFEARGARGFISPTDFNCMGYCVPAAIGAKLANPGRQVVGIVGDGALLMTGLEMITATVEGCGIAYFVFHDGELAQISQGQKIPYNRKTCTVLGTIKVEGIALATGARSLTIENDAGLAEGIREALAGAAAGQPVLVDVRVDYSKRTRFTEGVVQAVLERFPLGEKFRFVGRALLRRVTG